MAILGLLSTESISAERFTNIRRKVFLNYPNGAAPLTGLLSLQKDDETNDPEFSWYEKRLANQRTLTVANQASKGPFTASAGTGGTTDITLTIDTEYRIYVAATTYFRVGHVVQLTGITTTASATAVNTVKGVVTSIVAGSYLIVRIASATLANADNNGLGDNISKEVLVVGSAFAQGSLDISSEIYTLPLNFGNYTQIFRTPFSMTGTALKTAAKYDETGAYKDKAKEHSIFHMIEMERAALFGVKRKYVDGTTGLPTYTTGGLIHFLERFEAGDYGSVTAAADTDDDKRIIENTGGTINEKTYDGYLERAFRVTNNTANEKLVLCGSGFLKVINQMYRSKSVLNVDMPSNEAYGMTVVKHVTSFGTIYYKSHPLFTQNPAMRFNALIIDVQNLTYRPMIGRDTELLKNRQPNDADYRKDEWLTEGGFETQFPEAHMYIKNVTDYVP